ncbi:MAG: ABC transporter permease [Candidatus Kerfeldbacteria bacterium]|nr:ABC transporter permease [Candidatus Kerfeldbacteria bacterium]
MFSQAFLIALRSIWSKKVRSFLTMLGVIIGVAQIIALIGLGQGVKDAVAKQITDLGSNILFILPGKFDTENGGFNPAATVGASTLTEGDYQAIRALPDITDGSVVSLLAGLPSVGERSFPAALNAAVEPSYYELAYNAELVAGRKLNQDDQTEKRRAVTIDKGARKVLFPGVDAGRIVGQKIKFGRQSYEVVGVMESPAQALSFGAPSFENLILFPFETAKADFPNTQIFRIIFQTEETADVKVVAEELRELMLNRHDQTEDFTVFTQDDLLKTIDQVLGILTTAIVGLASISLIVGGIGIMNIMLVAVSERTKEIGLRKALGATRGNIMVQFLTESAVISLIGGAIGVGLVTVAGIFTEAKAGLPIVVNLNSVVIATSFSLGVGVVFGLLPAIRAARKDPIEALRYE